MTLTATMVTGTDAPLIELAKLTSSG